MNKNWHLNLKTISFLFCRQSPVKYTDYIDDSDTSSFESVAEPSEQQQRQQDPADRRYPKRERKPRTDLQAFLTQPKPAVDSKKRKKSPNKNDDDLDKLDALYSWYKWSNCKLAQQYDKERNFFPQPGPSNLNYYEDDDIVGYYRPVSDDGKSKKKFVPRLTDPSSSPSPSLKKDATKTTVKKSTPPKTRGRKRNESKDMSPMAKDDLWWHSDNSDWEDDIQIQSIYEQSLAESLKDSPNAILPTPPSPPPPPSQNRRNRNESDTKKTPKNMVSFLDQTIPTPVLSKFMENFKTAASNEAHELNETNSQTMKRQQIRIIGQCKITPLEIAPHHSDVIDALDTHKIPKMIHPIPHYSDPNDLVADNSKKEIGNTILQLHGNAINDCEEFQSDLNVSGLAKWQRQITAPYGRPRSTRQTNNSKAVEDAGKCRKFFAREQLTTITPSQFAPTHAKSIEWIRVHKPNSKKRSSTSIKDDSDSGENPAKIQRQNLVLSQIINNNNSQQKNSNDLKQKGSQERDIVSELLAKSELTVTRITRSNSTKKPAILQSTDENEQNSDKSNNNYKHQNDNSNGDADDGDDDDVIILSDNLPSKQQQQQPVTNSFCQVGRPRRIHLK